MLYTRWRRVWFLASFWGANIVQEHIADADPKVEKIVVAVCSNYPVCVCHLIHSNTFVVVVRLRAGVFLARR